LEAVNNAVEGTTAEIQAENESGKATFASRLATANRLAKRLGRPADNLTKLGQEYAEELIAIDPAIQMLIRLAGEDEELRTDENAVATFEQIREMAQVSQNGMGQLVDLANAMEETAGMSRELRRPLRRIQTALRNISDGREVVDEWDAKISALLNASE
jgi:hypothetical protein